MSETTQKSLSNINYKTNEYMKIQGSERKYKMDGVNTILIYLFTEYLMTNYHKESNKITKINEILKNYKEILEYVANQGIEKVPSNKNSSTQEYIKCKYYIIINVLLGLAGSNVNCIKNINDQKKKTKITNNPHRFMINEFLVLLYGIKKYISYASIPIKIKLLNSGLDILYYDVLTSKNTLKLDIVKAFDLLISSLYYDDPSKISNNIGKYYIKDFSNFIKKFNKKIDDYQYFYGVKHKTDYVMVAIKGLVANYKEQTNKVIYSLSKYKKNFIQEGIITEDIINKYYPVKSSSTSSGGKKLVKKTTTKKTTTTKKPVKKTTKKQSKK